MTDMPSGQEPDGASPVSSPAAADASESARRGAAVLLAGIRAVGDAQSPASGEALAAAAAAAGRLDRQLIQLAGTDSTHNEGQLVLGWIDGAAPDPDRHPSAPPRKLPAAAYLAFAVCLAAAWPDAAAEPYPGRPFLRSQVLKTAVNMSAARNQVVAALDTTLPAAGLVIFVEGRGALGPATAALPPDTWSELRRVHEFLPHTQLTETSQPSGPADGQAAGIGSPRRIFGLRSYLATSDTAAVSSIVAALEIAETPVAQSDLSQLGEPATRTAVAEALEACGRALVAVPDKGWTTGYSEDVSRVLARTGCGTLGTVERAVLALVLLRTVAIPRARGLHQGDSWTVSQTSTTLDELAKTRGLSRVAIVDALRELRRIGYVSAKPSGGYVPGPAFTRLNQRHRAMLWEDLIILARPNGYMAERIRAQRAEVPADVTEQARDTAKDSHG